MNNGDYKKLSKKSLKIVFTWAENNSTPLAEMYMDSLMGLLGRHDAIYSSCEQIRDSYLKPPGFIKTLDELNIIDDLSFEYRDRIGRIILNLIKRGSQPVIKQDLSEQLYEALDNESRELMAMIRDK